MRHHTLDEHDDELMRRWKGNGLGTYTKAAQDDERVFVFVDGQFALEVECAVGGVPILSDDDMNLLDAYMDEFEAKGAAVKH